MRIPSLIVTGCLFVLLGIRCVEFDSPSGYAQEITSEPSETNSDEQQLRDRLSELAAQFRFTVDDADSRVLTFHRAPILSYTNPVRERGQIGSIYLWTLDHRPAVIGSLWTFRVGNDSRRLSIELHRLITQPMRTELPDLPNSGRPLPAWNPLPDATATSVLPGAGLRQASMLLMKSKTRRNAERFTAAVIDPESGEAQSLRLLPKPIYEYETEQHDYGALYAFVMTTDPELFLHLQTHNTSSGIQLQYSFSRMTGRELKVKVDDQPTWSVDRAKIWDGTVPYYFCPNVAEF